MVVLRAMEKQGLDVASSTSDDIISWSANYIAHELKLDASLLPDSIIRYGYTFMLQTYQCIKALPGLVSDFLVTCLLGGWRDPGTRYH